MPKPAWEETKQGEEVRWCACDACRHHEEGGDTRAGDSKEK